MAGIMPDDPTGLGSTTSCWASGEDKIERLNLPLLRDYPDQNGAETDCGPYHEKCGHEILAPNPATRLGTWNGKKIPEDACSEFLHHQNCMHDVTGDNIYIYTPAKTSDSAEKPLEQSRPVRTVDYAYKDCSGQDEVPKPLMADPSSYSSTFREYLGPKSDLKQPPTPCHSFQPYNAPCDFRKPIKNRSRGLLPSD